MVLYHSGEGAESRDDVSRSIALSLSMRRAGAEHVRPDLDFVGIGPGFGVVDDTSRQIQAPCHTDHD
jgi:hypothetical protein